MRSAADFIRYLFHRLNHLLRLIWLLLAGITLAAALVGIPLRAAQLNTGVLGLWMAAEDEGRQIVAVTPGLPAQRAGLQPGDTILQINGRPAVDQSLLGPPGTRFDLLVRGSTGPEHTISLTLEKPSHLPLNLPPLFFAWTSAVMDGVFVIVFLLLGTVILWQAGQNQRGFAFLVALFLLTTAVRIPPEIKLLLARSGAAGGGGLVNELGASGYIIFPLLLSLFPNGRWQPRWIWLYPLAGLVYTLILILTPWNPNRFSPLLGLVIEIIFIGVGVAAQIFRYRWAAEPLERQQTKWAMFGIGGTFVLYYLLNIIILLGLPVQWLPGLTQLPSATFLYSVYANQFYLLMLAVPAALTISILRYRLWDIDLIIRRTLVYTLVTTALALVYFGTVVLLQGIFRLLTGQSSILTIVLSTLAISILFAPLRSLAHNIIDRRFYRRKYDAARTLDTFSTALRDEVNLDRLADDLVEVVDGTLKPEHVSLWIRVGKRLPPDLRLDHKGR